MVEKDKKKLPVTAIVIGRNEGNLLVDCLDSARFCFEIIYADMGSTDESKSLARNYGARVLEIEARPIVETVRQELTKSSSQPWILYLDPDERVSPELACYLVTNWETLSSSRELAAIKLPFFYYAFGIRLRGTIWGGEKSITRIVNRDRFEFSPLVHADGFPVEVSYTTATIPAGDGLEVRHMWLTKTEPFLKKHLRYLQAEGRARYTNGSRTTISQLLLVFPKNLYSCFVMHKGYKDGVLGLALSFFWAVYQAGAELSLLKFQIHGRRKESS